MKLPHHTRLHAHRDACEGLGYWQLDHRGLFAVAAVDHTSLGLFQFELEGWKLLPRSHSIWNVILETIVAAFGTDRDVGREHKSFLSGIALRVIGDTTPFVKIVPRARRPWHRRLQVETGNGELASMYVIQERGSCFRYRPFVLLAESSHTNFPARS